MAEIACDFVWESMSDLSSNKQTGLQESQPPKRHHPGGKIKWARCAAARLTSWMKRQAYGFRDQEFLRLKILGIHQTKYALVG